MDLQDVNVYSSLVSSKRQILSFTSTKDADQPVKALSQMKIEPRCEKTGLRGFRPGPTLTGLCNHTRWLEA